jgi:hypothetical protein
MWINKSEFDRLMNAYNTQANLVIKSHDRELMLVKQIIRLSEENCKLKNKLEGVKK